MLRKTNSETEPKKLYLSFDKAMNRVLCQAVSSAQGLFDYKSVCSHFLEQLNTSQDHSLGVQLLSIYSFTAHKQYSNSQQPKKPTKISHGPVFCILQMHHSSLAFSLQKGGKAYWTLNSTRYCLWDSKLVFWIIRERLTMTWYLWTELILTYFKHC